MAALALSMKITMMSHTDPSAHHRNATPNAGTALLVASATVATWTTPACAHGPVVSAGGTLQLGWRFSPWVSTLLALSLAAYLIGYVRLIGRGEHGRGVRHQRLAAFATGWFVLAAVLVSPLDGLSEALFSAHMVQHESMMIIAAPLLVLGRPLGTWVWALPRAARAVVGRAVRAPAWAALWRWLIAPSTAWLLHAVALWAWHAPGMFDAALAHPVVHTLQHASFLTTALLFWWTIVGDGATRRTSGHAMLSLFTTMVHTGALGALLTLAPGLWYPSYVEPAGLLGISALHDQQLGGLIMWVPAALAYLAAALAVAARWLTRTDMRPLAANTPCAPQPPPQPEPRAPSLQEPSR